MSARFEIVRTDAEQPWHARFRAANGRVVFTSETYTRRRAAVAAIACLLDGFTSGAETRDVDERNPTPPDPTDPLDMRVPSFNRVSDIS